VLEGGDRRVGRPGGVVSGSAKQFDLDDAAVPAPFLGGRQEPVEQTHRLCQQLTGAGGEQGTSQGEVLVLSKVGKLVAGANVC